MRVVVVAILLCGVLGLTACGDGGEVSDIKFSDFRVAMDGDQAAFITYFDAIKGKTVRWTGRVTESIRQHGDDYIEEGILLVDMDPTGQGSGAADVRFSIPVSKIDTFKPDQPVTYVAVIREFEQTDNGPVLKLELKDFE
jgi:hypothetical protein